MVRVRGIESAETFGAGFDDNHPAISIIWPVHINRIGRKLQLAVLRQTQIDQNLKIEVQQIRISVIVVIAAASTQCTEQQNNGKQLFHKTKLIRKIQLIAQLGNNLYLCF